MTTSTDTKVAIVTGGSTGLGRSLTDALAAHQWHVITDARHGRPWPEHITSIEIA